MPPFADSVVPRAVAAVTEAAMEASRDMEAVTTSSNRVATVVATEAATDNKTRAMPQAGTTSSRDMAKPRPPPLVSHPRRHLLPTTKERRPSRVTVLRLDTVNRATASSRYLTKARLNLI